MHSFERAGIDHLFLRTCLSEAQQKRVLPLKSCEQCFRRAESCVRPEVRIAEKLGAGTLAVVRICWSQLFSLEPPANVLGSAPATSKDILLHINNGKGEI
jgi:hypothetical protein